MIYFTVYVTFIKLNLINSLFIGFITNIQVKRNHYFTYRVLYEVLQLFDELGGDLQPGGVPLLLGDEHKVQALQLGKVGDDSWSVRLLVGERVTVKGQAGQLPHLLKCVQQDPVLQQVAVQVQHP